MSDINFPSTFRAFMSDTDNFDYCDIKTLTEHGASGGVSGLIYTSELHLIHEKYSDELFDIVNEQAKDCGEVSLFKLVPDSVECQSGFKEWMVWFAAETVAREIIDDMVDPGDLDG